MVSLLCDLESVLVEVQFPGDVRQRIAAKATAMRCHFMPNPDAVFSVFDPLPLTRG
jgi:hypothetical protein